MITVDYALPTAVGPITTATSRNRQSPGRLFSGRWTFRHAADNLTIFLNPESLERLSAWYCLMIDLCALL